MSDLGEVPGTRTPYMLSVTHRQVVHLEINAMRYDTSVNNNHATRNMTSPRSARNLIVSAGAKGDILLPSDRLNGER